MKPFGAAKQILHAFRRSPLVPLILVLPLLSACVTGKADSPVERSRKALVKERMQAPLLAGSSADTNTVILFTNPQCPACREEWPIMRKFVESRPDGDTKLIVTGRGFTDDGTVGLFVAALFAEQNQALARQFLTDLMKTMPSIPKDGVGQWGGQWVAKQKQNGAAIDVERYKTNANAENLQALLAGADQTAGRYGIRYTPTVIINGKVYDGKHSLAGYTAFMKKNKPGAASPSASKSAPAGAAASKRRTIRGEYSAGGSASGSAMVFNDRESISFPNSSKDAEEMMACMGSQQCEVVYEVDAKGKPVRVISATPIK